MPMNRTLHTIAAMLLLACTAPAAEKWTLYTEWPFDATEAKRRQQETAEAMRIPVKKTITIGKDAKGKPVTMDFLLIPAGKFVMGTAKPELLIRPRDNRFEGKMIIFAGLTFVISLVIFFTYRAIREKRRAQFSLFGLILLVIAVSPIA